MDCPDHFLGGEAIAGGKMKEPGTAHWFAPNTNATNSSGFTGLAAGNRYNNGSFLYFGMYGWGWSSTANNAGAWYLRLNYNDGSVCRGQADKREISLSGALKLAMPSRSVVSERYLNRQLFQLLKTIVMKKNFQSGNRMCDAAGNFLQ